MSNNQWDLYFYRHFGIIFFALKEEVVKLKSKNTPNLKAHPTVKLFLCIAKTLQELRQNPTDKKYNLGNTLSPTHSDWKRVKQGLPERYRMFFKYFSVKHAVFIAWINDEKTLRKAGSKRDCYAVFKQKLKNEIPSDYITLMLDSTSQNKN